jgi:hypothetical protein
MFLVRAWWSACIRFEPSGSDVFIEFLAFLRGFFGIAFSFIVFLAPPDFVGFVTHFQIG